MLSPNLSMMPSLESLSNELFENIVSSITTQRDLNALTRTSRTLYNRTTPKLYRSWSYHGLTQEVGPLRKFLETINWRPDLGALVQELDLREWGKDCPRAEEMGRLDQCRIYDARVAEEKRKTYEGKIGDDGLFDDYEEEEDGDWEEDQDESKSESEDEDGDVEVESIPATDEDDGHEACTDDECKFDIREVFRTAGEGFDDENIVYEHSVIRLEEEEEKLVVMLLKKLPNLRTLWLVMPEVLPCEYESDSVVQMMENASTIGVLQKLETLYMCSPVHPGGKGHREYDLQFLRLIPFMRLPNLRALYTLTTYSYNDDPEVEWEKLERISNIETLVYDESLLEGGDVGKSLYIFKALKSFRWTFGEACFGSACSMGSLRAPLAAHKDTLENLHIEDRWRKDYNSGYNTSALIGSLTDYPKLKNLAIDVVSLCGHQSFVPSCISLLDVLPPSIESLSLFVKVRQSRCSNGRMTTIFDNQLWYPGFSATIREVPCRLPKLRSINILLTQDKEWDQTDYAEIEVDLDAFRQATDLCAALRIRFGVKVAVHTDIEEPREIGLTEIPYFLEQIKGRDPGRDF